MKLEAKKTSFSVIFSILSLIITIGIDFFLSPYIVKTLGAEANGYVQIANNLILIASLFTIALNSMGSRTITMLYHKKDYDGVNKVYSSLIVGNLIIIGILILPSIICIWQLEKIIDIAGVPIPDTKALFVFAILTFFAGLAVSILRIGPFVNNKMYISYIVKIIAVILKALLYFLFFKLFDTKIYFISMIALISDVSTMIILFLFKKSKFKYLKFSFNLFRPKLMFELIKSGIWNTVNQCGNLLMTGFDLLLANWFINPFLMGVLSVSKTVPSVITQLTTEYNNSVLPNQTIVYASSDVGDDYYRTLEQSIKFSTVLITVPLVVFCVFSYNFYLLWQPTLDAKQLSILSILSIAALIPLSGVQALYNVLTSMNKLKFNSITFLICGILNVGIVLILINFTDLSIYAVAGVSSALTLIRVVFILIPYISKQLKKKWYYFWKYIGLSLICSSVVAGISVAILFLVAPNNWGLLILDVLLTAIISYTFLLFLVYNKKCISFILHFFKKRKQQ